MDERSSCPDLVELEALVRDALSDDKAEALLPHVGKCSKCQAILDQVSGTKSFLSGYQTIKLTARSDHSPSKEFVDRLIRETAFPEKHDVEIDQDLSFLTPSTNSNHLGIIGPYEVTEIAGRGGMGLVLRAIDPALEREIAVKVLSPALAANEVARERFLREARAAAAIDHENVLPIHAVHRDGDLPYFAMPLVAGQSMQELLDQRDSPLPVDQIIRISSKVANGLAAAHAKGLVHRDIKPANILLDADSNRVWLADFGLAHALESPAETLTEAGALVGTPQFMAPEQLDDQAPDERSDLFSLGAVLYYLATGTPPFSARSTASMIRKVIDVEPPSPSDVNPALPNWLNSLIEKLLSKAPEDRPSTAEEVGALIDAHWKQASEVKARPHLWMIPISLFVVGLVAVLWMLHEPKPFQLQSNGKNYAELSEAIAHAQDGDTIALTQPYYRITDSINFGKKKILLKSADNDTRSILDFTPSPHPGADRSAYGLPSIESDADLILENLTIMRKYVNQGHRDNMGNAPMIRAQGSQFRIEKCRFELQQPNNVGVPLADIIVSGIDSCVVRDSTFLHASHGVCLLSRNEAETAQQSVKFTLERNAVIGSWALVAFEHQSPRPIELTLVENTIATNHSLIFRPDHTWASFHAHQVEDNYFSLIAEQRMNFIRVYETLQNVRKHFHWAGIGNTIATLPPRPSLELDKFAMVRVMGNLGPGAPRPFVSMAQWQGWAGQVSELDFQALALEKPFALPADMPLDQVEVKSLVEEITSALSQ